MIGPDSTERWAVSAIEPVNKPVAELSLRRRSVLAGVTGFSLLGLLLRPSATKTISEGARQWDTFRNRFLTSEGRIVDNGNGNVSHSEGQGIGMLAAARFDDRASFDAMHNWTRATLKRPFDALHSWRYRPGVARHVDDPNNATDGDLLIALALFEAADRWRDSELRSAALEITRDVLGRLVHASAIGLVLLPGLQGFTHGEDVVINPSYYIFPALQRMAVELPSPLWEPLLEGGKRLLSSARFGRWALPPDWLLASPTTPAQPASGWPARFSFDAVRIPLYLTWAGMASHEAVDSAVKFWGDGGTDEVPAWADLETDSVAPYGQSTGMVAIRRYVRGVRDKSAVTLPKVEEASDYYAAALTMLTQIALEEVRPAVA